MTAKQKSIIADLKAYFKSNATAIIAFLALSWQISSKVGPYVYYKAANTLDTIETTRQVSRQLQRELSELKVETKATDNRQDTVINRLLTSNKN